MEFLEGTNVSLRVLTEEYFRGAYLQGINKQELDQYTDHAIYPKDEAALRDYAEAKRRNKDLWLGIFDKSSQKHVGNIELSQINPTHQKAVYAVLLWDGHGRGLAFEASRLIIKFGFDRLNLQRIELRVHEENAKAITLYEKLGFKKEGVLRKSFLRDGKAYDLISMGLLKDEFK